jgi:hypothetical protein
MYLQPALTLDGPSLYTAESHAQFERRTIGDFKRTYSRPDEVNF